jgi:hypothetical protein
MQNDKIPNHKITDDIIIYTADFALKEKLGYHASLKEIFTPARMKAAEKSIGAIEHDLMQQLNHDIAYLKKMVSTLKAGSKPDMSDIIMSAFSIKSRAGFCSYPAASAMAKSMYLFCERIENRPMTPKDIEIIQCTADAIKAIFTNKIIGNDNQNGNALAAQVDRMVAENT